MASGDTLVVFTAQHNAPPDADYATLDVRNGHVVLDFDDSTDESALFSAVMPRHYSAGDLVVTIVWLATSATSGNVVWDAAFERHQDDVTDLDSDSFAAAQSATDAAASASGEPQYTEVAFASDEIDGVAPGESFRLKVTRDADNAGDTMSGDAEMVAVEIREA